MREKIVSAFAGMTLIFLSLCLGTGCRNPRVLINRPYLPPPMHEPVDVSEIEQPELLDIEMNRPIFIPVTPVAPDAPEYITNRPNVPITPIAPIPHVKSNNIIYTVKKDDSLWKIARNYGVSMQELAAENNMSLKDILDIGKKLTIPSGGELNSNLITGEEVTSGITTRTPLPYDGEYIVKQGDSLWKIARQYRVSAKDLAAKNKIPLNKILNIGTKLTIPSGGELSPKKATSGVKRTTTARTALPNDGEHIVKQGDSLWKIARQYRVSAKELAAKNNISVNKILNIGTKLTIPSGGEIGSKITSTTRKFSPSDKKYIVKQGDSLWKIAKSYKLKTSILANANNLDLVTPLKIGQVLIIPDGTNPTKKSPLPAPLKSKNISIDKPFNSGQDKPEEVDIEKEVDIFNDTDKTTDAEIDAILKGESINNISTPESDNELEKAKSYPEETGDFTHEIQKGETLQSVTKYYGYELDTVKALNPGLPEKLEVGTTIKLP